MPEARKELTREFFQLFWLWYFRHYIKSGEPLYKYEAGLQAKARRMLLIEPRDHGKSVKWSCAYPLWCVLTNPFGQDTISLPGGNWRYAPHCEEIISLVSLAGKLPKLWIRRHKIELLYNRRLISDWGYQSTLGLRGADAKWTEDELVLRNGGHIYSKGSGAQIRGDHPTEAVLDDIDDRKLAQRVENRENTWEWLLGDVFGALEPRSRLKIIGTLVHPDSTLARLDKADLSDLMMSAQSTEYSENWIKFRYQAELPDGSSLAPEIWPPAALQAKKRLYFKLGKESVWFCEYMNAPRISENPVFPESFFDKDRNGFTPNQKLARDWTSNYRIITFCDPNAGQKEQNDWTCYVTLAYRMAVWPTIYVAQVQFFRSTLHGRVKRAINTWKTWHGKIGFEAINFQTWIAEEFGRVCQEEQIFPDYFETHYKNRPIKGEPAPKQMDKVTRAELVQELFSHDCLRYNYDDPMTKKLIAQLKAFPDDETNDDGVDALVGALWEVKSEVNRYRERLGELTIRQEYDMDTGEPMYQYPDTIPNDEELGI